MAIRKLRVEGDSILRKRSREVEKIDGRILDLLDDMLETMYENDGVGLAAVQVGILRRVVVIDVGEGPVKLINPVIVEKSGSQIFTEGCLSVPGKNGDVERPGKVVVEYMDEKGENQTMEGEGLKAVCLSHELDHLNGILFIDKVIKEESNE
ncbi:peptide deformylase [Dethiosulfatibacter aminovorans DSM 17477]|uniref:Peptide deformylase n=1 Tax=Dethiosulfatibacter aminovorans DSM 17477 TaxID=1121476 RepID=A0A1M6DIJ2_9FIRM|nr:peptide deformylase [Dethiosulfatibacter aminovorans]SHI73134.1 peptide deformylase [Dethiosulfatibacter aminovorans DSM 17477]